MNLFQTRTTGYLWNLKTQQLIKLTKEGLTYRSVFWSPDSSYIAYVQNAAEYPDRSRAFPTLHVRDVQTSRDFAVNEKPFLPDSVSWSSRETILFSQIPSVQVPVDEAPKAQNKEEQKSKLQSEQASKSLSAVAKWPDIYEVSTSGGAAKLLIHDGFKPVSSPDGKRIAFFSSRVPAELQVSSESSNDSPVLLLVDSNGRNYKILHRKVSPISTTLLWTPDSRRLLMVTRSFTAKGKIGAGATRVKIDEIDINTLEKHAISSFDYEVKPGTDLSEDDSLFNPLKVSKDGKYLFFSLLQFEESPNNGLFLKAINLKDGSISTLCRIGSVSGLDWHDESVAEPPASTRAKDKAKVK